MLEPVLAHYLMEYFADNKKRKRATKSVDIPTGTLIINYICVDITSWHKYENETKINITIIINHFYINYSIKRIYI